MKNRTVLKQLIGRVAILVILLIAVFGLAYLNINNLYLKFDEAEQMTQIKQYDKILAKKEFSSYPYQKLFGSDSVFWVLDSSGRSVYSADGQSHCIDANDLLYINDLKQYAYRSVIHYSGEDGRKYTGVFIQYADMSESGQMIIIDENQIVSNSSILNHHQLSEEELNYLTGNPVMLGRYQFAADDGNTYTMIVNSDGMLNGVYNDIEQRTLQMLAGVLIVALLLIGFFILDMRYRIIRPLVVLDKAIQDMETEGKASIEEYKGPKEYADIFNEFNDMSRKIADANKASRQHQQDKLDFYNGISHDLKTPITVIKGYTQALKDGTIEEESVDRTLTLIDEKADELNEMINQFYHYNITDHSAFQYHLEAVSADEYIRTVMIRKLAEIENKNMTLELDLQAAGAVIEIDRSEFRRAIDNIINNAIKHNAGNTQIRMLSSFCENSYILLIEDDGKGIDTAAAEKIFEPFVSSSANGLYGNGLGLSVARKIIEDHHGEIILDESDGKYRTVFKIVIPSNLKKM